MLDRSRCTAHMSTTNAHAAYHFNVILYRCWLVPNCLRIPFSFTFAPLCCLGFYFCKNQNLSLLLKHRFYLDMLL